MEVSSLSLILAKMGGHFKKATLPCSDLHPQYSLSAHLPSFFKRIIVSPSPSFMDEFLTITIPEDDCSSWVLSSSSPEDEEEQEQLPVDFERRAGGATFWCTIA
ncbi:hypothetical protein PLEOSDRAFT_1108113 [Pleurotus ostreatus PC15]|uniref:Uncharacterized protein n=1 Tax=Pleurotus ostreatus (strain PC15) TaxID=1137138 RepID=A0A067N6G0_PLEO1|nr:hypothetical protein PLEOSDRAFT_1108113 [Pleurotus ostreatus PC15]